MKEAYGKYLLIFKAKQSEQYCNAVKSMQWRQPELVLQCTARALRLNLHRGGVKWPLQQLQSSPALLLDTCCCPSSLRQCACMCTGSERCVGSFLFTACLCVPSAIFYVHEYTYACTCLVFIFLTIYKTNHNLEGPILLVFVSLITVCVCCICYMSMCGEKRCSLEDNKLAMLSSCAYWEICLSLWT